MDLEINLKYFHNRIGACFVFEKWNRSVTMKVLNQ
jgi:hypothetical protein